MLAQLRQLKAWLLRLGTQQDLLYCTRNSLLRRLCQRRLKRPIYEVCMIEIWTRLNVRAVCIWQRIGCANYPCVYIQMRRDSKSLMPLLHHRCSPSKPCQHSLAI